MGLAARQKEWVSYFEAGFPKLGLAPWSRRGACAVAGNCTQENLCWPVTKGAKDHGSDGGLQWRADRLIDMQAWCIKNFGLWTTIEAQAAFTLYETKRDYAVLDAELRAGSKSIATMATNFNRVFERSADNEELNNLRIKYAGDVLAALEGLPSPTKPVIVAGGTVATGGVVLASMWQMLSPLEWSIGANWALAVISGFLIWRLYRDSAIHRAVIVSAQSAATSPLVSEHKAELSLVDLVAKRVSAKVELEAIDAQLAKKIADVQTELTQAQGIMK